MEYEANVRDGKWRKGFELTDDPEGKPIDFIGLGRRLRVLLDFCISTSRALRFTQVKDGADSCRGNRESMARKTKPWDMKIMYHNRKFLPEEGSRQSQDSLPDLTKLPDQ